MATRRNIARRIQTEELALAGCTNYPERPRSLGSRKYGSLLLACFTLLGAASCESESLSDPRRNVIAHAVDDALLTDYRQLVDLSTQLHTRSQQFCAHRNPQDFEAMRKLWWEARAPWKRNEVFAFGPYVENPWRLGAKIDFWPVRPKTIEKTLASTELELTPEQVGLLGASATGMPVLEYLLFRTKSDGSEVSERACSYIVGLSADLVKDSSAMLHAWSAQGEDYRAQLVYASQDTVAFADLDEALGELVNRIGFTLENIRRDKLGAILGKGDGQPHLEMAESQWSGRAIQDIKDNLQGLEQLVFGPKGRFYHEPLNIDRRTWTGFPTNIVQLLEYRGFYMHKILQERFSACYAALDAIPVSLAHAASSNPESIRHAMHELGQLQVLIQGDVLRNLSFAMTFNDADGD